MDMLTKLLCLAVLPLLAQAKFHQTPQSQVVILGETVTLRCAVTYIPELVIYWKKGPAHISIGRNILADIGVENIRRYSIVGDELSGEYFLKIVDVKVEDAGDYKCAYVSKTSGATSLPAKVDIIIPPKADFPVCLSTPDPGAHKPGSTVELNCISLGGIPRANLTWTREGVILGNVTSNNNKVTRVLTPKDNGVYFTCSATSPALRKHRKCTIMPMKIPPSPMVKVSANVSLVGDNITASCHSEGIPAIGSYTWFIDGRPIDFVIPRFSAINHHLKIRNLRMNDNNAILTCMVTTTLGLTGNYSTLLKVELPTTTVLPTTSMTPTKNTDTATELFSIIDDENNAGTGVNTKNDIDTSVTRYNMKLILALIFGMLIFIFIIVLMTLTYFFASHTTRPRQKKSSYEDSTLGPNQKSEDPICDRGSKIRHFPHYPQTYVSQEIPLSPDDPMMVGSPEFSGLSNYPESSAVIEIDIKGKLTDEEKLEYNQAAFDPIINAGFVREATDDNATDNDAADTQEAPMAELVDSSKTSSEQWGASQDTGSANHPKMVKDLDERKTHAMTSNTEKNSAENETCEHNTESTDDVRQNETIVNSEDDAENLNDVQQTEAGDNRDSNSNTIRYLQLAEEVD
ncbi:uncharacterized protein LOC117120864 [Anneissia japonica]|uniref:uncharacterized protein LOC117120864 n=1 Tax=Anneissia japonica TaxID=1529436 RepID=UPI0014255CEA|nr:uncharacterized protein LOC117120864 [Anneissia japonica]